MTWESITQAAVAVAAAFVGALAWLFRVNHKADQANNMASATQKSVDVLSAQVAAHTDAIQRQEVAHAQMSEAMKNVHEDLVDLRTDTKEILRKLSEK